MRLALATFSLAAALAAGCAPEPRESRSEGPHGQARVVPGLLAVDWKDGTTKAQFDAKERQFGIDVELNSPQSADEALTIAKDVQVTSELLARLRADPLVEHAEPVYEYDALFVPNDPEYKLQWHLKQVGAESAWEWGTGAEVVVAVIDTGVSHLADLKNTRFVAGYDFVNDDSDADDDNGHGSHVAGTIAQSTDNGTGVAGLAHRAAIMPVKVLGASGGGTTVDIADAIRWAVDHDAKVLNLSLGGGGYSEILADAVRYARSKGAIVVCAAGNGFGPPVNFPAAYEGAFAVSAVRFDKQLAPYSSFGPEVDIAAPGGDTSVDQNEDGKPDGVLQQTIGEKYAWLQGTSMATPHVAGAAALLAGAGVTRAEAVERILQETAGAQGDRDKYGAGLLDAGAALRHVRLFGGFWRLAVAVALTWLAWRIVRKREGRTGQLGVLGLIALIAASSGFFVLPIIGFGHSSVAAMLSAPLPEWGQMLHGAMTSSPLWLSALGPFLLLGLSRWRPLSGISTGLCLGIAAYLLHASVVGWVDVAWIPGRLLEAVWLAANGVLAFMLGTLALRPHARR